jgi:predicted amidohydrolase
VTVRLGSAQPAHRVVDYRLEAPAALAQAHAHLDALEALVERAGQQGCDALCLPEDALGLLNWEAAHPDQLAELLPEAIEAMLTRLGQVAARHAMYLVCCSDALENGDLYNTSFFLGRDGRPLGRYRKINMPYCELGSRRRGDEYPVFTTPDLGPVGLLVCYDMVFPEAIRCLALGGAGIVFHSTLGGACFGDAALDEAAFRVRAVDNQVYLVVSWRGGGSRIIAPSGQVLATAEGKDSIAIADIAPHDGRQGGNAFDHQQDLRARLFRERVPASYSILTDPEPPVLKQVPTAQTPEEVTRIANATLTVGEDRFNSADSLSKAGKVDEATDAFRLLQKEFPRTWIDRVAAQRLQELADQTQGQSPESSL